MFTILDKPREGKTRDDVMRISAASPCPSARASTVPASVSRQSDPGGTRPSETASRALQSAALPHIAARDPSEFQKVMPATAHTFPGRYFPRLDTVQILAADQGSSRWPQAASIARQAAMRSAYIVQTSTALSTSHPGSTRQSSGWARI